MRYMIRDMRYTILGIDPGLADTGYGVIEKNNKGKLICQEFGVIKTKSKKGNSTTLFAITSKNKSSTSTMSTN